VSAESVPVSAESVRVIVEICMRCGAHMEWRHGTFQCPRCRFKIGCCEGETGDCRPGGA
jgi:ribosomal protein L40E